MTKKYHDVYMQIWADYETNQELEIEKAMVGILGDGLSHGNWPWTSTFKVGDRVRSHTAKVDGVGTVSEARGMQVMVIWDDVKLAPTMAAPAYFYLDTEPTPAEVQANTWGPWGEKGREGK